jgi:hypothetical protein
VANNVIEIIIRAIDQASAEFKNVNKESSALSLGLGKLKTAFAGLIAGVSAGAAFRKFINESAEAEESAVRLDIAFKAFGERAGVSRLALDQFAKTVQNTTQFSDDSVTRMQAVFLRFGNVTGDTFQRAQQVAVDLAAALGTDLEGSAQRLGLALQSPTQGMRVLRQAGIVLTAQERELLKSFEETGKIAAGQDLILKKLEGTYKGTAQALANTFNGALKQLQNQLGEIFESPSSLSGLTQQIKELTEALKDPAIQEGIATFGTAVITTFRAIAAVVGPVVNFLGSAIIQAQDLGTLIDNKLFNRPVTQGFIARRVGGGGGGGPASRAAFKFPEAPKDIEGSGKKGPTPFEDFINRDDGRWVALLSNKAPEITASMEKLGTEMATSLGEGFAAVDLSAEVERGITLPLVKQTADMTVYAEQAARNIQDAFAQFFFDPFKDGLRGLVAGFADAIRRMIANAAAAKFLEVTGIAGFVSGLFGKAGGGYAKGWTMVGEEGPEMLRLPGGSRVFNQRQLAFNAGAGGGTAVAPVTVMQNNVFNNTGAVTQEQLAAVMSRSSRELTRGIIEAQQRNRGLA